MGARDRGFVVHPLERGVPPAWASAWGDSKYGPWAAFEVNGVGHRLRWIPPGHFTMGSPEDEPGRFDREGPQHEVTLSEGFWLGETPCTQDLWQAVTGDNPSRFPDPRRPVEQVSWEDVQVFLQKLEALQPGLHLRLPTEAQWEYACRAGSTEATYAGPIELLGANHAPVLDAIAWYGGNSGVDYDHEVFEDSSGWPDKHHPHARAGTRRVKTRRPNAWGLYDMLGNVYEWCQDWYGAYNSEAAIDPLGAPEGALRVFRGGGWCARARRARAAARDHWPPSARDSDLGFRLSRGPGAPSLASPARR